MHNIETKNQFIELRARGLSLDAISTQLSVSKTTLGRWHHESLEQIQRLRALQWHLLEDQIGERLEDTLRHIAQRIRKWDDKLDQQLDVYQKPGDSIRVIRESRREYLQLRAILLAPLQPARRNAPCLTSLDPEKRDKTGQNPDARDTTPLPPNDLQQPETSTSHSVPSPLGETSSVEPAAPSQPAPELETDAESCQGQANVLPLPRAAETQSLGENEDPKLGWGEGQTGTVAADEPAPHDHGDPHPSTADAVRDPATDQSKLQNPKSKIGSASSASSRLCAQPPGTHTEIHNPPAAASNDLGTPKNDRAPYPLPGGEGMGEGQTGSSLNPQPSTKNPQLTYELMRIDCWQ